MRLQVAAIALEHMLPPVAEAAIMLPEDYKQYALTQAEMNNLNVEEFMGTLACENAGTWDPMIQSGVYKNGEREESFGIAQIHLPSNPDISYEQATDGIWSIDWAAEKFKEGREYLWTCWKNKYGGRSP